MQTWNDLFQVAAGAAATLAGLIFIGISINLQKIISYSMLPLRALIPLVLLLLIIILSIIFLIPGQSFQNSGILILIISIIAWLVISGMNYIIYKRVEKAYKKVSLLSMLFDQVALIQYIISGILLINGNVNGIFFPVAGFILSFIKVFMDAWILTIEINR